MGCDCYKVGGPFIAEDPDCPIHGREAQLRESQYNQEKADLNDRVAHLEETVVELQVEIRRLASLLESKS